MFLNFPFIWENRNVRKSKNSNREKLYFLINLNDFHCQYI